MSMLVDHHRFGPPISPTIPAPVSLASKLVSWYDFENNLLDAVGANILTGTTTYAAGKVGQKAVKSTLLTDATFNGLPTPSATQRFSMGGWLFIKGTTDEDYMQAILSVGTLSAYIALRSSGTRLYFIPINAAATTFSCPAAGVPVAAGWHFVVGNLDPGTNVIDFYVDNMVTPAGSVAFSGTPRGVTQLTFGRTTGPVVNALDPDCSFVAADTLTEDERVWLLNSTAGRNISGIPAQARGAWTWFNDPRSLAVSSNIAMGATDPEGRILAYSGADPLAPPTTVALQGTGTADDHDNPAFLRRESDGRIMAFHVRHNATAYYLSISTNPDDASSFGAATNIVSHLGVGTYAYANPVQLTGETNDPIYLFTRKGTTPTWTLHMSKSVDDGVNWSTTIPLMGNGRPYCKVARNGTTRIDFLVTDGHPGSFANNGVYHFYYEGGAYYDSYGTSMGAAPFATSSMTQLWDGSTAAGIGWIWDICIGPDGYPVVVFSNFPSTSDHRYRYARFNGTSWVQSEISAAGGGLYAGEPYYSGGVCIDRNNVSKVYASRQVSGKFKLYKYITADAGASFDGGSLMFEPPLNCFRPYQIENTNQLAYLTGYYNTYNVYGCRGMLMEI